MTIARSLAVLAVLAVPGSTASASPRPTAARLLLETAIRERSGFAGLFAQSSMEPAHGVYDDTHFKALGFPEAYDVALRVWNLEGKAADDQFDGMHDKLPHVLDTWLFGGRVFTAEEGDIFGVVFEGRGVVTLLTCGKEQCRTLGDVLVLACEVWDRL